MGQNLLWDRPRRDKYLGRKETRRMLLYCKKNKASKAWNEDKAYSDSKGNAHEAVTLKVFITTVASIAMFN